MRNEQRQRKWNVRKNLNLSQSTGSSWNFKMLLQSIYGTFRKKSFMWRFPHLHFQFAVIVIELMMFVNMARHIFFLLKGYFLCVKCIFMSYSEQINLDAVSLTHYPLCCLKIPIDSVFLCYIQKKRLRNITPNANVNKFNIVVCGLPI